MLYRDRDKERRELWEKRYRNDLERIRLLKNSKQISTQVEKGGKTMVYVLLHPKPGFTGHFGAVDFSNGIGSTSSKPDRDFLVLEHGCKDVTDEFFKNKEKQK